MHRTAEAKGYSGCLESSIELGQCIAEARRRGVTTNPEVLKHHQSKTIIQPHINLFFAFLDLGVSSGLMN